MIIFLSHYITARFRKFCHGSLEHKLVQIDMSLETISVFHEGLDEALQRLGKQNIRLKECQYEAVKAVVTEKNTRCVFYLLVMGSLLFINFSLQSSRCI